MLECQFANREAAISTKIIKNQVLPWKLFSEPHDHGHAHDRDDDDDDDDDDDEEERPWMSRQTR